MTTGAVIFAYDNNKIDYVAMAIWTAKRLQRWLDIPVTLVTDREISDSTFDKVITRQAMAGNRRRYLDLDADLDWYNLDRCTALDITPYDRTMVIDADYVVNSRQLATVLRHGPAFTCHRTATDLASLEALTPVFGEYRMPQWWATVMIFDRCSEARAVFDSMHMIRDHWSHYCDIYAVHRATFRNDYALSIALGLASGHSLVTADIPWSMISVLPEHRVVQQDQDRWRIEYQRDGRAQYVILDHVDFHAMNKRDLGDIVARNG